MTLLDRIVPEIILGQDVKAEIDAFLWRCAHPPCELSPPQDGCRY